MSIDIYLNFNGNCREAVEQYAQIFNQDNPHIMTFGDAPPNPEFPVPEEAKHLVVHARLQIGASTLMFSDVFPGMPFAVGNNITLSFSSTDEQQIRSVFDQLKVDGTVQMELQETFFSKCYGNVTDKFGIIWQLNLIEQQE